MPEDYLGELAMPSASPRAAWIPETTIASRPTLKYEIVAEQSGNHSSVFTTIAPTTDPMGTERWSKWSRAL